MIFVSRTIGALTYGVSKKVKLHAVKVLRSSGSGSISDALKGVEYVITEHRKKMATKNTGIKRKSVANMSLGGSKSKLLDQVVNQAVKSGIHFAVAAGNSHEDACEYSPAASEFAVTVGASDIYDNVASFSNYGECVDIFAPGKDIISSWIGNKYSTKVISGTSMASPHVAGVMALFLSEGNYTPHELKVKLTSIGQKNKIKGLAKDSPNILLYSSPPNE